MLEGLEIKEVQFSSVNSSELLRLEAEFHTAKSFDSLSTCLGAEIIDFSQYGTSDELNEERKGYPVLRLNEFDSYFITTPSKFCNLLDEETYQSLRLRKGDVLICRTNGNPRLVGKSAIVPKNYDYAYASYLFKIRPKQELINSATLVAYLNSKFGRMEIEKFSMASNQVNFSPAKFREMRIPKFGHALNAQVDKNTFDAFELLENSKYLYAQAETLLLDTLGMADFSPSAEAINVKSFKDSFVATGRLDAEYYQPKYEQVVDHITAQSHARLIKLVDIKKSIEPGSDAYSEDEEGLPFLRVADYRKYGITKPQKKLSAAFVVENRADLEALKPKKNTILFSKDGSVGEAYCLREDADFVTSGAVLHFTVLDPAHVLPEYLTLALNSKLVRMQAERDAGGSIILHWRVGEIENVVVPLVDMPTQEKISAMVQESFSLKAESELLLDVAKRAVEIAIEQDETAGMAYIEANS